MASTWCEPRNWAPKEVLGKECFICLGDERGNTLESCCSQCYARVHPSCWEDWRMSQRLSFLRARILGQALPSVSSCSICKTGCAGTTTDKKTAEWKDSNPEERERIQELLLQAVGRVITGTEDTVIWPAFFNGNAYVLTTGSALILAVFFIYEILAMEAIILLILSRKESIKSFMESLWSTDDGLSIEDSLRATDVRQTASTSCPRIANSTF